MDISIGAMIFWAILVWFLIQAILGVSDAIMTLKLKEHVEQIKYLNNIIHNVEVEKHGDMEYWFDKDSQMFLGQGRSTDEIISHIKSRFPDHIFMINGLGGIAKHTDWKLLDMEEFKKLKLKLEDI